MHMEVGTARKHWNIFACLVILVAETAIFVVGWQVWLLSLAYVAGILSGRILHWEERFPQHRRHMAVMVGIAGSLLVGAMLRYFADK